MYTAPTMKEYFSHNGGRSFISPTNQPPLKKVLIHCGCSDIATKKYSLVDLLQAMNSDQAKIGNPNFCANIAGAVYPLIHGFYATSIIF